MNSQMDKSEFAASDNAFIKHQTDISIPGKKRINNSDLAIPPPLENLRLINIRNDSEIFGLTFGKNVTTQKFLTPPNTLQKPRSAENLKHRYKTDGTDSDSGQFSNIYLDVNEYKTFFRVCNESPRNSTEILRTVEPKYNWEYDSDTLNALNRVTKRFDSFRMRQLKAKYFYAAADSDQNLEDDKNSNSEVGNKDKDVIQKVNIVDNLLQNKLSNNSKIATKTDSPDIQPQSLILTPEEKERIEFFYSSLGSQNHVAGCVVDVLASIRGNNLHAESLGHRWVQVWVGVPVLVLNVGCDRRKPRRLTIVIAQRDTGLTLWKETVTYATDYRQIDNEGLHLLNEGRGSKRALKIRWSDWDCAKTFMEKFVQLTSDRNDPLWLNNGSQLPVDSKPVGKKSKTIFRARDIRKHKAESFTPNSECQKVSSLETISPESFRFSEHIRKRDISLPVNARIVTRVDSKDVNFRTTFAGLLPVPKTSTWHTSIQDEEFRPRLPTN